jgi:hypothetical protein
MNKFWNGFYFTLFDYYRTRPKPGERQLHLQFAEFWSECFEDYIYERLREGYAGRPDVIVYPEQMTAKGLSTDVVVAENGDIMFVEVVAKRLNLQKSVVGLDDAAIEEDLRAGIALKIEQLSRNIVEFRNGNLFPDIDRRDGYRVFPLIVMPTEWPRIYVLGWFVPALRAQTAWLEGCEPLELLDVAEVERLEAIAAAGNSITALLHRKSRLGAHNRLQSLHNYLTTVERGMLQAPVPAKTRGNEVARRILDLYQTWC